MLPKHISKEADSLQLEVDALLLRPWQSGDVDALVAAVQESTESVGRWLSWCHADYGTPEATSWISNCQQGLRDGSHLAFAIIDAGHGELIGAVGLNQFNQHGCANMGYWIRSSRQRQGLCTIAAMHLARFGFEKLELIRIEIVTLPDNVGSRRTAEKMGAHFETVARNRLLHEGKPCAGAVYGLIAADLCHR